MSKEWSFIFLLVCLASVISADSELREAKFIRENYRSEILAQVKNIVMSRETKIIELREEAISDIQEERQELKDMLYGQEERNDRIIRDRNQI